MAGGSAAAAAVANGAASAGTRAADGLPADGLAFVALARAAREFTAHPGRYAHGVRVGRLAGRLAARHGVDPGRARVAGLLHDVARLWPPERLLAECEARALPIDAFERRNPVVLHAPLGAELARERFGVHAPAVLAAIRAHTLAGPAMTPLDTIVYVADGVEPGRSYPDRAELERLAFRDLDAAYAAVLRSTLRYLERSGLESAPRTHAALHACEARERRQLSA